MKPAVQLAAMLEKDWQKQVRDLAETLGYRRAYHTFDSRRSDSGFPDLVLVSPIRKRIIFLELKREHGKVTESQAAWLRDLHRAGAEVYVARPRHFDALATVLSSSIFTRDTGLGVRYHEARGQLLLELDPILEAA